MSEAATIEQEEAGAETQENQEFTDPRDEFRQEMERRRQARAEGESSLIGTAESDVDDELGDELDDSADDQDDDVGNQDGDEPNNDQEPGTSPSEKGQQKQEPAKRDVDNDAPLPSEEGADSGGDSKSDVAYNEMIKGLPAEAREMISNLQQQAQRYYEQATSLHGRLAPMQQKNADLQKRLDELQEASKNPPTPKDLEESPDWKEVQAEFPDEAGNLKTIFGGLERANQEMKQQLQDVTRTLEEERNERIQIEMRRVRRKHQDFDNILQTPHFQQWRRAVESDPAQSRLARMLNSFNYEDVAEAVSEYKKQYSIGEQAPAAPPPDAGQQKLNHQHQATTHRREPPPPPPPSQGAQISGQQRLERPLTDREQYARIMRNKAKQRKRQQR